MNAELVRFVLVEPTHPGNVGGVARAMKTMGLSSLCLVRPYRFPDETAFRRAAGAEDLLQRARVCDSLDAAIGDCVLVCATSARERSANWPTLAPREAAGQLAAKVACGAPVAVLFGQERAGLNNRALDRSQAQILIPANPEYSSLNLASAAQIIAYEVGQALAGAPALAPRNEEHATAGDLSGLYAHIEETLERIDFIKYRPATKLMRKLIRLFNRAAPTREEVNIVRGMMTAMQDYAARCDGGKKKPN